MHSSHSQVLVVLVNKVECFLFGLPPYQSAGVIEISEKFVCEMPANMSADTERRPFHPSCLSKPP